MKETLTLTEAAEVFSAVSKLAANTSELLSLAATGKLSALNAATTCNQIDHYLGVVAAFTNKARVHAGVPFRAIQPCIFPKCNGVVGSCTRAAAASQPAAPVCPFND